MSEKESWEVAEEHIEKARSCLRKIKDREVLDSLLKAQNATEVTKILTSHGIEMPVVEDNQRFIKVLMIILRA